MDKQPIDSSSKTYAVVAICADDSRMTIDSGLKKEEAEAIKSGTYGVYRDIVIIEERQTAEPKAAPSDVSLRGSVQYHADIVAPLGEKWEADL